MSDKEELTLDEKATLLGHVDARMRTDYDEGLYDDLCTVNTPVLDQVNDRKRRAIIEYIMTMWKDYKETCQEFDQDTKILAALTEALIKGYEVGRRRKRRLTGGR